MTSEEAPVGRRNVLRGGAIMAGAAAGAVIAGAQTQTASAAVGDPITVGGSFSSNNTATALTVDNSTQTPALRLVNPTGPALLIPPVTDSTSLEALPIGAIAGDPAGPLVGVTDGAQGSYTTYLATGVDLANLPVTASVSPLRVLDTRSASGRSRIVGQSASSVFDSSFRLKAGVWIDVAVLPADQDFFVDAVFVNVTVTGPQANGFVTAYPPGDRPVGSTLNYVTGQTIANGAFVAAGPVGSSFAIRLYTTSVTHLIVDLTGATTIGVPGSATPAGTASKLQRSAVRTRPAVRRLRMMGRTARR